MSRFEGTMGGKDVITYTPKGHKQYNSNDIGQYLRQFKLCNALRLIGGLSHSLSNSYKGLQIIEGVPISNGTLAYLSMRLIENSNDYRGKDMTIGNLLIAVDMVFGLQDPFQKHKENPLGCLIRYGASQLDYEREVHHLLSRTLIIYEHLWSEVPGSTQADVSSAIQSFSGLTLQEMLVLSLALFHGAKNGFFRLFEDIENCHIHLREYFEPDKQKAFANWISCGYKEFREKSRSDMPSANEYERFRFNPLHLKPAITPDRNPKPGFPQVYIAPIPTLIYEKVTRGLYFSLTKHFECEKGNPFRSAFGSVFQEYVGLLLKQTFGEVNVQKDWKYGPKKHLRDTPDWFVIQNGAAVLIEVKQAGLYLNAKKWGELEQIGKDLTQSIGSGANQMWEFEQSIESGSCTVPDWLNGIEITERLVVTYDRSYFLNSILRGEVKQLYPSISETYHWHTIAVEELEYFLGIVGTDFIEALKEKRLDPEGDRMDFRDYYARKYSQDDCINPYLDRVFDNFFSELGIPSNEAEVEQFH